MFKKYRILEAQGVFIPQFRDDIFSSWYGMAKLTGGSWYLLSNQISYCSYATIEKARASIDNFTKKTIIKIHKY